MEGQHKEIKKFWEKFGYERPSTYSVVFLLLFVTIFWSICYETLFHIFFCNKILDENSVPTPKIASSKTQFSSIQKLFAACLLSIFPNFFFFFISPLYFQIYSKVSKIWIIERPKRSAPRTKIGFDIWSIIDEEKIMNIVSLCIGSYLTKYKHYRVFQQNWKPSKVIQKLLGHSLSNLVIVDFVFVTTLHFQGRFTFVRSLIFCLWVTALGCN